MKTLKLWGRGLVAALVLACAGIVMVSATQTGTNSTQASLFDQFCDQCQIQNSNLRNLVASTVTLQDAQTVTGAKTFNNATITSSAATITGGTITGTNVTYTLAQSSLPLIGLSSGSVSSSGVISAITALPGIYPHAFCYMPASILATSGAGSTAGWYYCTFTGTQAGTVCLNQWTPGTAPPTIPTSCTAVTAGQGSFTGDSTEQGVIVPIPANAFGANGRVTVNVRSAYTNSAGTKTLKVRFSGASGTTFQTAPTSTTAAEMMVIIANDGTTNNQIGSLKSFTQSAALAVQATPTFMTVDTTAATDVRITETRNTATDNTVIENFNVQMQFAP